jgi:histone H2A
MEVLTDHAAVYLTAVLEYLSADILELAGNAARNDESIKITPRHITLACRGDKVLDRLVLKTAIRQGVPLRCADIHPAAMIWHKLPNKHTCFAPPPNQ